MFKLILLGFVFLTNVLAQELATKISWQSDFKTAIENAQKVGKPLLFVSSRHSCKYCVILEETTFEDANVINKLNSEFVSVIAYSDERDYMPRELWRPGTPAIWFLYPDGTPMFQPLMGAVDAENFLKALHIVKSEFDKNTQKK
jgi:thioredoxin-related protein